MSEQEDDTHKEFVTVSGWNIGLDIIPGVAMGKCVRPFSVKICYRRINSCRLVRVKSVPCVYLELFVDFAVFGFGSGSEDRRLRRNEQSASRKCACV